MDHNGRIDPSAEQRIDSVNFKLTENDEIQQRTINRIVDMQRVFVSKPQILTIKLIFEGKSPFVLLNTNLSNRPLKLLVDTGATLSLVSQNTITNSRKFVNYRINLYGLPGRDAAAIQTSGMVNGTSTIGDCQIGTSLHLIDGKYTGNADGYLGFDFLTKYKAIIDLGNGTLALRLGEIENIQNELTVIEPQGIDAFAIDNTKENQKSQKKDKKQKKKNINSRENAELEQRVIRNKKQKKKEEHKKHEKTRIIDQKQEKIGTNSNNETEESVKHFKWEAFRTFKDKINEILENGLNGLDSDGFEGNFGENVYKVYDEYDEQINDRKKRSKYTPKKKWTSKTELTTNRTNTPNENTKENTYQFNKIIQNDNAETEASGTDTVKQRAETVYAKLNLDHCSEGEKENM